MTIASMAARNRQAPAWKLDCGACMEENGVRFRVYAPKRKKVEVVLEPSGDLRELAPDGDGFFSGLVPGIGAGALYRYRLDGEGKFPDPYSRYQPEGPHGPSCVVDPEFGWTDEHWPGLTIDHQVIYELHVGTFTPEGTFEAVIPKLEYLKDLGATALEIMPVADFPGRWNWGYDGVDYFAPSNQYGGPAGLKKLVNACHGAGLGILLDVVYNHLGPDGNYIDAYNDTFFSKNETEWGRAINYDGPGSKETREFFIRNACYWVHEFHMDGLRLDATQSIFDSGPVHILAELSKRTRAVTDKKILLIAENESQDIRCITPAEMGGFGLDAIWTDDFHHSVRVALTGLREAYYVDYTGRAQEFVSAVKRGFLYQGQYYQWQKKGRGSAVRGHEAKNFVFYNQNHDQIANHVDGERLSRLADARVARASTAMLLLSPETPLLFMGQEFDASSPFLFFADHNPELAPKVFSGRKQYLTQFPSYAAPEAQARIPDPAGRESFERCKLDWTEKERNRTALEFHRDLLRIRREDPVISAQRWSEIDGAVLSDKCFVFRYFGNGEDRLLLINFGGETVFEPSPEPLLAPLKSGWSVVWSTEDARYGGGGAANPDTGPCWRISGPAAVLLATKERDGE